MDINDFNRPTNWVRDQLRFASRLDETGEWIFSDEFRDTEAMGDGMEYIVRCVGVTGEGHYFEVAPSQWYSGLETGVAKIVSTRIPPGHLVMQYDSLLMTLGPLTEG